MSSTESTKPNYSVPNLERSFVIMEEIGKSHEGLTLTELVNQTGFPQNSIFRISRTLGELGYLNRNADTKRFQLTQRILNLALGAVSPGGDILKEAVPKLLNIAHETGETCCFGTIADGKGVVLAVEPGKNAFRFHIDLGTSFYLHTAAPGKAMLAVMENKMEVIEKMEFPRFTEHTITDQASFLEHLEGVAAQGYGVDLDEDMIGQHCVGAAIRTTSQHTMPCAIWITAPASRLPESDFPRIGKYLQGICQDIENKLEFN